MFFLVKISLSGEVNNKLCAKSSAYVEYNVVAMGVAELLWLKVLPKDIGIQIKEPMIFCSNH